MREIRFRAWDRETGALVPFEEVTHWDLGNYELSLDWDRIDEGYFDHLNADQKIVTGRFSLMQYTGLYDKNGVEIYEGDILKYVVPPEHDDGSDSHETYEVVWRDFGFSARWLQARDEKYQYIENTLHGCDEDIEVIGNIYENPELLEAKS